MTMPVLIPSAMNPFGMQGQHGVVFAPEWYAFFASLGTAVGVTDGDKGDVTVSGGGLTWTINDSAVTYAKMQDVSAASRLLGRGDSGAGEVEEITLGAGLTMTGTVLSASGAAIADGDYGDITVSSSGTVWTIDANVVTNAKLADMATATFKGRTTAGTGDPEDLTVAQAKTLLNLSGTNTGDQTITLTGDVTGSGTGSFAATIANDAVTFAKMQNIATDRLIGRDTAGTGDPEEISVSGGLEFTGSGGIQRSALTGDVTATAGSNATTIANDAVTDAKLRNSGALSVIGRSANSSGDPADISASAASGAVLRESGSTIGFGTVATAGIADAAVTYAKIQDVSAASKLLGRGSAGGSGDVEEITLGSGLTMTGTTLSSSGGSGAVVQMVNTMSSGVATGTTIIPVDDTIPQNTEGDEYMTRSITPTSSTNKLRIDAVIFIGTGTANRAIVAALFQDTTANALAAVQQFMATAGGNVVLTLTHFMTAGTTSSTTFKIRCGPNAAATLTFNGGGGTRQFGGVAASSITITEVTP